MGLFKSYKKQSNGSCKMDALKLFSANLIVKVLEYEFSTPKLIKAKDAKQAYRIIKKYAREYYGEGEFEGTETFEPDTFSFNGGCPIVEFTCPVEVQDEGSWKTMAMDRALISMRLAPI